MDKKHMFLQYKIDFGDRGPMYTRRHTSSTVLALSHGNGVGQLGLRVRVRVCFNPLSSDVQFGQGETAMGREERAFMFMSSISAACDDVFRCTLLLGFVRFWI